MSNSAVISNRIYLTKTKEVFKNCTDALTYKIQSPRPMTPPEIFMDVALVGSSVLSLPVSRVDLIPPDYNIIEKRVLAPVTLPDPKVALRPDQVDIYDQVDDNWTTHSKEARTEDLSCSS